ncbi:MAG: type II secretion system F family protein, partial [Candidatus Binatia bacterium]
DQDDRTVVARLVADAGDWLQERMKGDKNGNGSTVALLSSAGWRGERAIALYTGATYAAGVAVGGCAALVMFLQGVEGGKILSMASSCAICGYLLPRMVVSMRAAKRKEAITKSIPDVIDMLILCVEAGLGLNAAIKRVGDERSRNRGDVMGSELKLMNYQLQAGRNREEAFQNLADRNGVEDLRALAAFMIQSDKLGTNVADALRIYAAESRTQRRQRAQESANKAAVKLLFPLVFFIFPTMFLVILGPAIMQLRSAMP